MIGFLPLAVQSAIRAIPVTAARVAASPITAAVATGAAVSLSVTVVSKGAADTAAQRKAEQAYQQYDAKAWNEDPRTVRGFGQRVKRNVVNLGEGIAEEARVYRFLITPGIHLVTFQQCRRDARRLDKLSVKMPKDGVAPSPELLVKMAKAKAKAEKHLLRYERVRGWYQIHKDSRGEKYLAFVLNRIMTDAQSGEPVQSPGQGYEKLLDQAITAEEIALLKSMKAFNAGLQLHQWVTERFTGDFDLGFIQSNVLHGWLSKSGFNNSQIRDIRKGWSRANSTSHGSTATNIHEDMQNAAKSAGGSAAFVKEPQDSNA